VKRLQFAVETLAVRAVFALARWLGPVGASNAGGALARWRRA